MSSSLHILNANDFSCLASSKYAEDERPVTDASMMVDLKIPGVEVGYRLKIGTEDDSSLRAHLGAVLIIPEQFAPVLPSAIQPRTIPVPRCCAQLKQENEQGSQPTHGALLAQGPGCGQPRKTMEQAARRLPCLGIPPATLRGQGDASASSGPSPQSTRTTYTGQQIVGQLTDNAVHPPWTHHGGDQGPSALPSSEQRLEVCPVIPASKRRWSRRWVVGR